MKHEPAFTVGEKVTVCNHYDRDPVSVLSVIEIRKRPKKLILSDGSEWEFDGWRPYSQRKKTFYSGPTLRAYEDSDDDILQRDVYLDRIQAARTADWKRLPNDLLAKVYKALGNKGVDDD